MELSDDFILSGEEMTEDLFTDNEEEIRENPPEQKDNKDDKDTKETTEESPINEEDLFDEPESVGSGIQNQEKDENTPTNKGGTSPKTNFYSSIASALKDEGILPDLDDNVVSSIKEASDFAEAIEKQIQAKFDERQKRIDEALNADVEPDKIRLYEQTLSYLDSIKDSISEESDNGENLRKKLIYQDFINRGYSKERALREVKKSFDSGTDLEDAKEALVSNKQFFDSEYQNLIREALKEIETQLLKLKLETALLKKSMLEDKEIFSGITLDKSTRQKAFDNITKPVYKTEDGIYLTAILKYLNDNPVEFRKYLSVLFTMTDGFKSLDKIIKGKVNREVKQSLRELEHKLSNSSRSYGSDPKFVGIGLDDAELTYRGWLIDV